MPVVSSGTGTLNSWGSSCLSRRQKQRRRNGAVIVRSIAVAASGCRADISKSVCEVGGRVGKGRCVVVVNVTELHSRKLT